MLQPTQFAIGWTGEDPFVPINLANLVGDGGGGYTGSIGVTELTIQNGSAVSGNIVLSTDPSISSEAAGFPIAGAYTIRAAGNPASDRIQLTELYVFSATASKDFSIYIRSLP